MRKATILIMAVALVLGLAQCKKNTDIVPVQSGTATITLKVNGDDKLSVNPNTGTVGFTKGDVIYVVSGGKYCGTLVHGGENFSGTIAGAVAGKLYFYFLGNKTPSEELNAGSTGTFTVSIYDQTENYYDQTENYPVISVGVSTENYDAGTTTYTSTLLNQCALVKFNVTTSSEYAPTIITGVNDKLVITLAADGIGNFDFSEERGAVKMPGGSGERWAILFPQGATSVGAAYSADLSYRGMHGELPAITENDYLTNGINVNVNTRNEFTVASDGKKVRFSQGNLQYQASTNTWRFAENQYDRIGDVTANSTPDPEQSEWMDLFGWGTSGEGACAPTTSGNDNSKYAYPGAATNITDTQYDWGVRNGSDITNNYGTTSWCVMTKDDHDALYTASRRAYAVVNGVKGLIVIPDNFIVPSGIGMTMGATTYATNSYELNQWTLLEAAGAVFLPAAGYRIGASVYNVDTNGNYWSSTTDGTTNAFFLYFSGGDFGPSYGNPRYYGFSVRLVSVL